MLDVPVMQIRYEAIWETGSVVPRQFRCLLKSALLYHPHYSMLKCKMGRSKNGTRGIGDRDVYFQQVRMRYRDDDTSASRIFFVQDIWLAAWRGR